LGELLCRLALRKLREDGVGTERVKVGCGRLYTLAL
jgi:hypothetical protein